MIVKTWNDDQHTVRVQVSVDFLHDMIEVEITTHQHNSKARIPRKEWQALTSLT
jgi:hypothetical protein